MKGKEKITREGCLTLVVGSLDFLRRIRRKLSDLRVGVSLRVLVGEKECSTRGDPEETGNGFIKVRVMRREIKGEN